MASGSFVKRFFKGERSVRKIVEEMVEPLHSPKPKSDPSTWNRVKKVKSRKPKPRFPFDSTVYSIHIARINIKSLTAEARLIRKECNRAGAAYCEYLRAHRTGRLRREARVAHLALAYIRNRKYRDVENQCWEKVSVKELREKLHRFGCYADITKVTSWMQ